MRYTPKSIANYFLHLAELSGQRLDAMKLQKLVYYAHGWYAGHTGEPLINEQIEAWPYGPVIPSLYHEFKAFGSQPIMRKATEYVPAHRALREVECPADEEIRAFLHNVWMGYRDYSGLTLSEFTHAPNSPWDITRRSSNGARDTDIQFELIRDHFAEAVKNSKTPA